MVLVPYLQPAEEFGSFCFPYIVDPTAARNIRIRTVNLIFRILILHLKMLYSIVGVPDNLYQRDC